LIANTAATRDQATSAASTSRCCAKNSSSPNRFYNSNPR
jgi:hypothetical protein